MRANLPLGTLPWEAVVRVAEVDETNVKEQKQRDYKTIYFQDILQCTKVYLHNYLSYLVFINFST